MIYAPEGRAILARKTYFVADFHLPALKQALYYYRSYLHWLSGVKQQLDRNPIRDVPNYGTRNLMTRKRENLGHSETK